MANAQSGADGMKDEQGAQDPAALIGGDGPHESRR